eukprot:CAMPEP_0170238862 /NCGR_PEP_ID=MMETSP0116_2-20130129/19188_1 /TAXON_ID=400756 /ORGANISM="Durinskia baltica, Strain CSIRO CS-38" /LENGTH=472 /DNA_ID=CAMNT_0010489679 /DNA_START=78 /DNA_END=1496 /DNA_ORIENTATION=-
MAPAAARAADRAPQAASPGTAAGCAGQRKQAPSAKAGALRVTERDVIAAVESLYRDELRPYGRLLILRLAERLAGRADGSIGTRGGDAGGPVPRIDVAHLRRVCERCRGLRVVADGAEYTALIPGLPERFVDAGSNDDPFPETLWVEAQACFRGPAAGATLPGSRYACAKALAAAGLPFLAGLSLGQICHFVQLAISRRRLLGCQARHIVAFERSDPALKERCARERQPIAAECPVPVATLEDARAGTRSLLDEAGGLLPLTSIKRRFLSSFQQEFSETALGFARIADLFRDECFADICKVSRCGDTVILVSCHADITDTDTGSSASNGNSEAPASGASPRRAAHAAGEPRFPVARTFIHFSAREASLGRLRRASSMRSLGSSGSNSTRSGCVAASASERSSPSRSSTWEWASDAGEAPPGGGSSVREDAAMPRLWAEDLPVARTFIHFSAAVPSEQARRPRAHSAPGDALR